MKTILTLTDSRTHGGLDSIYELLLALSKQEGVSAIWVADRALVQNKDIFEKSDAKTVFVKRVDPLFKFDEERSWFRGWQEVDISEFDVTLIRLDRPVSDRDLYNLGALFSHTTIVNNPKGIIETGSKEFLLRFPELCPPMSICKNLADIEAFALQYDAVFKPLHGYGGAGIVRMSQNNITSIGDDTLPSDVVLETMQSAIDAGENYLGMKFLKTYQRVTKE